MISCSVHSRTRTPNIVLAWWCKVVRLISRGRNLNTTNARARQAVHSPSVREACVVRSSARMDGVERTDGIGATYTCCVGLASDRSVGLMLVEKRRVDARQVGYPPPRGNGGGIGKKG